MFFLQTKMMKFHIHILSFFIAILHFFKVLAEIFKNLNSVRKDTENAVWISKRLQNEDYTDASFDVFEYEDTLNLSSSDTEDGNWTSEVTAKKEDNDSGSSLNVFGDEGNPKDCTENSNDASSTSELTSKLDGEDTEMKLSASIDEENLNDWCSDLEENCRTSALMLNSPDKETESKIFAYEDEGNLVDLNKKFEGNSKTLRASNLQVGETKTSVTSSADEDDPNSFDAGPFMCNLFEKQLYTDVNFYFKGNTPLLSAHRAVLAAKCNFFENMLFGNQNNEIVGMEIDVQIKDIVPCHVFTSIVRYFYTNEIEVSDDYAVLEIFAAAKIFHIRRLIDQCKRYIESIQLTENNVCSILEVCTAKHIDRLKARCISYIQKNTLHVISSTDFEKCTLSTVQQICNLEYLNLNSEVELLEGVLRWISVQKLPEEARKEFTRCLLKNVRVLSFTPKEFSNVIQRHTDLMTPDEGLQILIFLNNPSPDNFNKLPKWCNKNLSFFQVDHKNIQRPIFQEYSGGGKIKISLKPIKEQLKVSELTALLHMRCIKGMQQIKSIKFSFESIADEGCELEIKINISPNGPAFLKKHFVKSRESTFTFKMAVIVCTFQTVQMEVKAESRQSCKFLQFDRWYNDPRRDFECFFISKPKTGRLYFISEIEYEPLAPQLMAAPGDGFKTSGN